MQESTPKPTSDQLRMALRLRLSLLRAGNGRQSAIVFMPQPARAPVSRAPTLDDTNS